MRKTFFLAMIALCLGEAEASFLTTTESGGTFPDGASILSGMTRHDNVVPGSVQIVAGNFVWSDDGNGKFSFTSPGDPASIEEPSAAGVMLYASGAWSIRLLSETMTSSPVTVRYSYYTSWSESGHSAFETVEEDGGTFAAGACVATGMTAFDNVVSGSVQIVVGDHVLNDCGDGNLRLVDQRPGMFQVTNEMLGTTSSSTSYSCCLANADIVPGSVVVRLEDTTAFTDNGDGTLKAHGFSGSGSVNYTTGAVVLEFNAPPTMINLGGKNIYVSYQRNKSIQAIDSGTFQYASGAWSISGVPAMEDPTPITVRYSHYVDSDEQMTGSEIERIDGVTWWYSFDVDGSATVVRIDAAKGTLGAVSVPTTLGGRPVTAIGDGAFASRTDLASVSIPDGVVDIGDGAFERCTNLSAVELPTTLRGIGNSAFRECVSLASLAIPAAVTNIGHFAFRDCLRLSAVDLSGKAPPCGLGAFDRVPAFAVQSANGGFAVVVTEIVGSGNVSVPENWALQFPRFEERFGSDFAAALSKETGKKDSKGNAMKVWQDYVAGTDPTDPESLFTADIVFMDGSPVIRWSPELSDEEAAKRKYTILGKTSLTNADWTAVAPGTEANYNFFSVSVEMK